METRILIAEDIDLVAEAFQALLETEETFRVVGRVNRGDKVLPAVARMTPDLVLLDIDMPGATGIQATAQLRQKGYRGKIVLLTVLTTSGYLQPALDAGANGYLLKTITGAALKNALKAVMAGHSVVDPELAAEALRSGPSPLTERETEVLRLVAEHRSTSQIAGQLHLSVGTIRNYLSSAMTKLAVNSRFDAADLAKQNGWLAL